MSAANLIEVIRANPDLRTESGPVTLVEIKNITSNMTPSTLNKLTSQTPALQVYFRIVAPHFITWVPAAWVVLESALDYVYGVRAAAINPSSAGDMQTLLECCKNSGLDGAKLADLEALASMTASMTEVPVANIISNPFKVVGTPIKNRKINVQSIVNMFGSGFLMLRLPRPWLLPRLQRSSRTMPRTRTAAATRRPIPRARRPRSLARATSPQTLTPGTQASREEFDAVAWFATPPIRVLAFSVSHCMNHIHASCSVP
jgi:hypothetical protein